MANRPPFLCNLEKGKFVTGQTGFVDTFNWAVRAIDNLEGGKNCTIDWTIDDHPVINVDLPEGAGGGSGGGDYGKVVEDVTEDTQDDKDGLKILYTDGDDSFIPFPTLSAGTYVSDVDVEAHSGGSVNDKIVVEYSDGTENKRTIPFDPAINNIQRKWKSVNGRNHEYLSCTFNRGPNHVDVPFDIRISSIGQNGGQFSNDASRFMISAYNDTNLRVGQTENSDGITLMFGVYYV